MRREVSFVCGVKGNQLPGWVQSSPSTTVQLVREAVNELAASFSNLGEEGEKGTEMVTKFGKHRATLTIGKGIPVPCSLTARPSWVSDGDSFTVVLDGEGVEQLKKAFTEAAAGSRGGAYAQFNFLEGAKVELKFNYEAAQ